MLMAWFTNVSPLVNPVTHGSQSTNPGILFMIFEMFGDSSVCVLFTHYDSSDLNCPELFICSRFTKFKLSIMQL